MSLHSQKTLVQSLNKSGVVASIAASALLHLLVAILAALSAPSLYYSAKHEGSSCTVRNPDSDMTWYKNGLSSGSCIPVTRGDRTPLRHVVTSFRFPRFDDEISSYSCWNWRILASLSMDITFYGSEIPDMDTIFPNDTTPQPHNQSTEGNSTVIPVFSIAQKSFRVIMRGKMETSAMANVDNSSQWEGSSVWTEEAVVFAEKTLMCSLSTPLNDLIQTEDMDRTAQYICSISPLIDISLPANKSYIITLEFLPDIPHFNSSESQLQQPDEVAINSTEYFAFFENDSLMNSLMVLVVESKDFHKCIYYTKCIFAPFTFASLIWFSVKMYLNDLYISIPDRLLICSALAQFIQNIPTEVLIAHWEESYLKIWDDFAYLSLICCLLLFWVVYAKDKLAKNEPWERNTKYYWKQILLVVTSVLVCALFIVYSRGATLDNPFNNHWTSPTTVSVSLAFVFGLVSLSLIYQLYLSMLVFRLLCDVSVQQASSMEGLGRIKIIILYCYGVSLLTVGGFILRLAIKLSLNWNQQFFIDPVPFQLTYSSPFYITLQAVWNIHITSLLIFLSRSGKSNSFIKPVKHLDQSSSLDPNQPMGELAKQDTIDNGHHHEFEDGDFNQCVQREDRVHFWTLVEDADELSDEDDSCLKQSEELLDDYDYHDYEGEGRYYYSTSSSENDHTEMELLHPRYSSTESHDYCITHSS